MPLEDFAISSRSSSRVKIPPTPIVALQAFRLAKASLLSARPLTGMVFVLSLVLNTMLYGTDLGSFDTLLKSPDAQGYAQAGRALLFGTEAREGLLSLRGYAYPTIAIGLATLTPMLLVLSQTAAIAVGVGMLVCAERVLTGRVMFTPLAGLSVSLLLAPAVMMTESFAFLLGAAAIYALVARNAPWAGILCLGIAFLIKPAFLPIFLVSLLALPAQWKSTAVLAILITLITPNFLTSARYDDTASLASAGSENFSNRFYPAVFGQAEGMGFISYKSPQAAIAKAENPQRSQQVAYVLSHPVATLRIWSRLLWDRHLMQASGFSKDVDRRGAHTLKRLSEVLNKVFLGTALLGLAGLVCFVRQTNWRFWPAALLAPSMLVTAPLVYGQGDRIVLLPLLFLLPFAGLAVSVLFSKQKPYLHA